MDARWRPPDPWPITNVIVDQVRRRNPTPLTHPHPLNGGKKMGKDLGNVRLGLGLGLGVGLGPGVGLVVLSELYEMHDHCYVMSDLHGRRLSIKM